MAADEVRAVAERGNRLKRNARVFGMAFSAAGRRGQLDGVTVGYPPLEPETQSRPCREKEHHRRRGKNYTRYFFRSRHVISRS